MALPEITTSPSSGEFAPYVGCSEPPMRVRCLPAGLKENAVAGADEPRPRTRRPGRGRASRLRAMTSSPRRPPQADSNRSTATATTSAVLCAFLAVLELESLPSVASAGLQNGSRFLSRWRIRVRGRSVRGAQLRRAWPTTPATSSAAPTTNHGSGAGDVCTAAMARTHMRRVDPGNGTNLEHGERSSPP